MVGINIQCRFGNQLFQFFYIKNLSKDLNTSFFINDSIEKFLLNEYFDIDGFNILKNSLRKYYFKIRMKLNSKTFHTIDNDEDLIAANHKKNNKLYNGYFQSQLYFKSISKEANKILTIKPKYQIEFKKKYNHLFNLKKNIVIHIRRGDYTNLNNWWKENLGSNNLTLPIKYYHCCLEKISNIEEYQILFISDDIQYVTDNFRNIPNSHFIGDTMINDFQILLNSDILILSNSSFSWWGGYLNQRKNKVIFCPENWLGFKIKKEYPLNIIPENWIQIPANY